ARLARQGGHEHPPGAGRGRRRGRGAAARGADRARGPDAARAGARGGGVVTLHRSLPLSAGLLLAVLLAGPAPGAPEDPLRVDTVTETDGFTRVKVALGGRTVEVGQTVEVRRGERTVGYGAVESVDASGHAVALIGTVVADAAPLQ